MTDEELAEQRRAKDRERKRLKRLQERQDRASRAQWLAAHSISRDKPWLALDIQQGNLLPARQGGWANETETGCVRYEA
jgi:hypothetical protein